MVQHTNYKTLGDLINEQYSDYRIVSGSAPMDMDLTHGTALATLLR